MYDISPPAAEGPATGARTLREAMARGRSLAACFLSTASAANAEVIATAGFDVVIIDCQHGQVGDSDLTDLIRILERDAVPAVVRVARNTPYLIGRALDAGAAGVIVPLVNSAVEARDAADAGRYPPLGSRSFGPLRAALRRSYSVGEENADIVLAIMVETAEALESIDRIAEVAGVDALFTGPADLGLSLGVPPTMLPAEGSAHEQAIVDIATAAHRAGRAAWVAGTSPEAWERWSAAGYDLVSVGSDVSLLAGASRAAASRTVAAGDS